MTFSRVHKVEFISEEQLELFKEKSVNNNDDGWQLPALSLLGAALLGIRNNSKVNKSKLDSYKETSCEELVTVGNTSF